MQLRGAEGTEWRSNSQKGQPGEAAAGSRRFLPVEAVGVKG